MQQVMHEKMNSHQATHSRTNKNVKQMLDLLEQGENILRNQYREHNVTIILGNGGSGKSTFTQWITGDGTQLISKEDPNTLNGFIIKDTKGKIGNSITGSHTMFPELIVKTKTAASYYDFPGFYDTRGAANDIVKTYFIKKVLDRIKTIKMLFIVNHNSVTNQGTRDDFTKLVKFTAKFIKNIDKFQNSIALIASRVSNFYSTNSDNQIIRFVAHFIEEVRQKLVQNTILLDLSEKEKTNAIKFLDMLLVKNGEAYSKIGIFRSPNKEGPLSNIPLLQENKRHIEMLLEKLHFTTKTIDDFCYAIPASSQFEISGIVEELNKNILTNIRASGEEIKKYFSTKEETVDDIKNLYNEIRSGYDMLLATQNSAKIMEPKECIQCIKNNVASIINSNSINHNLSNAIDLTNYLKFVQTVSGQNNAFKCSEGLDNVIIYLNDAQKWYHFVVGLYDKLSKCYVLQNVSMYDITNLIGKGDRNKKVIETNLEQLLQKIYQEQYYLEYSNIKDVTLDKFKLDSLKQVSNSILNYQIKTPSCSFHNMTMVNNKSVTDLYNPLGFVNELQGLENQFYKLSKEFSFLPFYKSLLYRISQYAENINSDKNLNNNSKYTDEDKKVLCFLYTATLSKICSINNNLADNLVVDLQGYLKLIIHDINRLKSLSNTVIMNEHQLNYQQSTNAKTTEAIHFIETQITPEINNVFNQMDHQIELLINETIALQNESIEEKNKLIQLQQELGDSLVLRKLLGCTKIASQFLSFIGPVGAVAGATIGTGIMVAESLVLDDLSGKGIDRIVTLPSAVKNSVTRITDQLKNKQQLFKEQLYDVGQKLEKFLDEQPSSNIQEIKNKILDTKLKLDKEIAKGATLDPESIDKMHTMRKEVAELLQNQKEVLEKQKPNIDVNIEKQLRLINHVQHVVGITEISIDFYGKIRNHQAKIDKLGDAIKQADNKIMELEQYEKDIYKTIIPMCRDIENSITALEKNLQGKSHVALDVSKWQIQSTIKDIKLQMQKMTKGFKVQEDLVRCIDKLEEGISIMINVYDRIEDYHDKAELAAYISNINSNKAIEIKVMNKELNDAIDDLNRIIQSNLVLERYEAAMNAFRQYIFPFVDSYLAEFNLPYSLESTDTNSLILYATGKIEHLRTKISESIVTINKYDKYIYNNVIFNSEHNQTSQFFVWKHDLNKHTISKLLEGEEVALKSDIKQGLNKNAIKFNVIGVKFKLMNKTIQHEFDKELKNFELTMIHSGNSYYRCDNKVYVITSDNQTISYSLAKNNKGEPLNRNLVYDKIKISAPVLSPYTMWNIKLKNSSGNFGMLVKYKNQVIDLELEGRGQYVDNGINICNDKLNRYYTLDDTITISHHNDEEIYHRDVHHGDNGYISDRYRGRRDVNDASNIQYDTNHVIVALNTISDIIVNKIENNKSKLKDRGTELTDYVVIENTHFASSSTASNVKSPINTAINWLSGNLKQLKFLNPANIINYEFVKDGIKSLFGVSKQLNSYATNDYSNNAVNVTEFNVNDSVVLADLLTRCFTKVKPYNSKEEPINLLEVKAYALNIITEFEEVLNAFCIKNGFPIEDLEFYPIDLSCKLEKEIINGNCSIIGNILYQSILNNNPHLNEKQYSSYLLDKIIEMSEQQNVKCSYQQLISDYTRNDSVAVSSTGIVWGTCIKNTNNNTVTFWEIAQH